MKREFVNSLEKYFVLTMIAQNLFSTRRNEFRLAFAFLFGRMLILNPKSIIVKVDNFDKRLSSLSPVDIWHNTLSRSRLLFVKWMKRRKVLTNSFICFVRLV